jgi:hypothetical protein
MGGRARPGTGLPRPFLPQPREKPESLALVLAPTVLGEEAALLTKAPHDQPASDWRLEALAYLGSGGEAPLRRPVLGTGRGGVTSGLSVAQARLRRKKNPNALHKSSSHLFRGMEGRSLKPEATQ